MPQPVPFMDASHRVNWNTALPWSTKRALTFLSRAAWFKETKWYLAGGTALALHEGHRQSVDLDFFTKEENFSPAKLTRHFTKNIWKTDILREGTLYGTLYDAKVSFIAYPLEFLALKG